MNAQLSTVQFHEQQITVLKHNDQPYVAMRPIAENIGLDWDAQRQRIKRHAVLSEGAVIITAPSKGGKQDYLCLPLSMLNGWLFGIEVNRVKPEIRPILIQYQFECFDVLYKHFMPKIAAQHPSITSPEQKQHVKHLVQSHCFNNGLNYRAFWNVVFNECGFNKLENLTVEAYHRVLAFFENHAMPSKRSVTVDTIEIENLSAFLKTFDLIRSDFHFLLQLGNLIDAPRLVSLWSKIDHANFIYSANEQFLLKLQSGQNRMLA